jgi:hypothetical protein
MTATYSVHRETMTGQHACPGIHYVTVVKRSSIFQVKNEDECEILFSREEL